MFNQVKTLSDIKNKVQTSEVPKLGRSAGRGHGYVNECIRKINKVKAKEAIFFYARLLSPWSFLLKKKFKKIASTRKGNRRNSYGVTIGREIEQTVKSERRGFFFP